MWQSVIILGSIPPRSLQLTVTVILVRETVVDRGVTAVYDFDFFLQGKSSKGL